MALADDFQPVYGDRDDEGVYGLKAVDIKPKKSPPDWLLIAFWAIILFLLSKTRQ